MSSPPAPALAAALSTLRAAGFSLLVAGSGSSAPTRWLRVADVAARWSVSACTVRRMIARGELAPVLAWATEIRVSLRAVEQWERAHMKGVEGVRAVEQEERNGAPLRPRTDTPRRRRVQKGGAPSASPVPPPIHPSASPDN